jgi:hypothetical protein
MPKLGLSKIADLITAMRDVRWARHPGPSDAAFSQISRYCMFLGFPRSAHTLVGSLVNAHPDIVISHELNALRWVSRNVRRDELFRLIIRKDRSFTESGSIWTGYDYSVAGQWQGKFRQLRVIGDKKAGASALLLRREPALFDRLQDVVRVPVSLIIVVRNPFDNISTMVQRSTSGSVSGKFDVYARMCEGVEQARKRLPEDQVHIVSHEEFTSAPREMIRQVTTFLGQPSPDDYLDATSQKVRSSARRSRDEVQWSTADRERVRDLVQRHSFLAGYDFDS